MNCLDLVGLIEERGALRHTPAGLPALDLRLTHESEQAEAGQPRQVRLTLKAVAIGLMAERLNDHAVGLRARFTGFLASPRQSRQVVFHIQDFQPDSIQGGPNGHVQEIQ